MKIVQPLVLLLAIGLTACGKKAPDPVQQVRAFMADWQRAVESKNPAVLDSVLVKPENAVPIDASRFLAELYNSPGVKQVKLVERQFAIGEVQASVTGRLVRSGIPDSLAMLSMTLLKTNKGWRVAAYRFSPFEPLRNDTAPGANPL